MCIIIENKTGSPIPQDIADRCTDINSDGFGIVYMDGKGGEFRTLDMVLGNRVLTTETRPYVAHCRFTTVGETNTDGIHPFPLGKGRYLFQNGTIKTESEAMSDTYQIAEVLRGLPTSKIAFMLTALDGCRWAIVDTKKGVSKLFGDWHNHNGVRYSKDNVLKPKAASYSSYGSGYGGGYDWHKYYSDSPALDSSHRTTVCVYGTLKYAHGNHSLIKDSDFLGYGFTASKMRLCIEGLPYVIRGKSKIGKHVEVEVYSVDDDTLARLDALEGHPDFYRRDSIDVKLDTVSGQSGKISAQCYMVGESYDNGVYHNSY